MIYVHIAGKTNKFYRLYFKKNSVVSEISRILSVLLSFYLLLLWRTLAVKARKTANYP